MKRYRTSALAILVFTVVTAVDTMHAQTTPSLPGRVGLIDERSRVVLSGNRHPLATSANDRGKARPDLPMKRMILVLKRDATTEANLRQLIAEQHDRLSPNYHSWLTPEEFAARFGMAESDRQKIAAWLGSHGFSVDRVSRGGMSLEFSGTASQVESAFGTAMHIYEVGSREYYANASDPQIPAALESTIAGVNTLHSFEKPSPLRLLGTANRVGNTSLWAPNFSAGTPGQTFHFLAPGDFAKIYNATPLYQTIDGTGQTIAIVGRSNINISDIELFRIAFGLPSNNPQIIVDGPNPGSLFNEDETEADLDVEWAGAVAPKATIKFVVSASTNNTDGVDLSAQYIVDNNIAPILSTSFGQCEALLGQAENTFINNLWEQAAAEGITVIASSGDSGAAGCDYPYAGLATQGAAVSGVASTPYNVALGGTQFNENGADSTYWSATDGTDQSSVLGYIPEVVWNESCADQNQCGFADLFATGGGPSALYSKPTWQAGPGVPADGKRDLPDLSFSAAGGHDGYLVCQDGSCITDAKGVLIAAEVVGGTSASAPAFAGVMALVNQKTNSRQGQANFILYPLAAGENAANCNASGIPQTSCIFNDITQGNNNVPGQTGYAAGPGYDLATGLGSINITNLVNNWSGVALHSTTTQLQLSPATATHGQPVNASVTVTSSAGIPTGDITLQAGTRDVNLGGLANGSLSTSLSSLPGGSYTAMATYGGDGVFGASTSTGVPITISPESSILTFTTLALGSNGTLASASSTTFSSEFFLQASVAGSSGKGTATGTVAFTDSYNGSTTTLMTVPLNSQANLLVPETSLGVGTHTLSANYSGDPSFTANGTSPVTVTVGKGPTQTILFVPTGALPNSSVTLAALIIPTTGLATPTGTVQFYDGSNALGNPVSVIAGEATLTVTQMANGSNTVSATYSGDANFNGSTSTTSIVIIGNPDFQIAANPGDVTVTSSTPGKVNLLLSPGAGLGFFGNVSFSCSGLPTGASCAFQPTPLSLDGYTTANATLTITGAGSSVAAVISRSSRMLSRIFVILGAGVFCLYAFSARRSSAKLYVCALTLSVLCISAGCGGSGNSSPSPTKTIITPVSGSTYMVTVTASGSYGSAAVSHTVNLAVTFN